MNLLLKTILVSCCLISFINLTAQQTLKTGIILNKIDSIPIESAHIINLNSNYGTKSNVNGAFSITSQKKDTLLISFIGFQTLKIIEFKNLDTLYLEKETFTLELYTVLPYKNFKEFKEAFVKLELKDTVRKINTSFVLSVEELRSYIPSGIPLFGSYRNRDKENYERLLAKDKYQAFLDEKFNSQLIERITILNDSSTIDEFMQYCDFTDKFIELSSDYELIDQVFVCYEEYKSISENCHSEQ